MVRRLRTTSFAGFGAVLLVLIVSGMVAAASVLTAIAAPEPDQVGPAVVDTTQTFEDANGNGIDDDCETGVVADETAAAAADAAVDLNGDGTVSVSEAAQSDRTGGTNCNHGGYVSQVAHDTCGDTTATGSTDATEASSGGTDESETGGTQDAEAPDADCAPTEDATDAADTPDTEVPPAQDTPPTCDAGPTGGDTTPTDTTPTDTTDTPKNHGAVVSAVAGSDAVGGKNCNHGGAVSDANKAAKAEKDSAKLAAREARLAAHGAKTHGKHGKHGQN